MSPLDTIFGWIMVGLSGTSLIVLFALGLAKAAARPRPTPEPRDVYEMSPYGPVRKFRIDRACELRGHQYGISEDGTHWVCVRGDDRVPTNNDLDQLERYANGEEVA